MFNFCRRGFAPISRLSTAATSISASTIRKQSIIPLSPGRFQRTISHSRLFHSSILRASFFNGGAAVSPRSRDIAVDGESDEYITKFQDLADRQLVHKNVIDEIVKGMGHETMTQVQSMTINETLKGTDVVAQARTGTGKTLGFLVPVIQNILTVSPELAYRPRKIERATPSDIRAIIISPTRELAEQLAVEARKLTAGTGLKVQAAVGGNNKRRMLSQMQREGCHLLVATPGRLFDLLSDPRSKVAAPDLSCLVLDEADRLLDKGFSEDIREIIQKLPDREVQDRQTLLFSATIPPAVMRLVNSTLKPDFKFVQTVQKGDLETHQKIKQNLTQVMGMENIMPAIVELSKREIEKNATSAPGIPFKAIIYFSATSQVNLAHAILYNLKSSGQGSFGKHPLWPAEIHKIHAKLSQEARTKAADRFRRAKSGILISTDVTARGLDFPNVSHVIQIGLASDRDSYIHRLGRTGRGDKQGEGWLIVTEDEARAVPRIFNKLPIVADDSLETAKVDMTRDAQLPGHVAAILQQVGDATQMVGREIKNEAYMSTISNHTSNVLARRFISQRSFMASLKQWARYGWGWDEPPESRGGGFGGGRDRGGFGGGRDGDSFGGGRDRGDFGGGRGRGGRDSGNYGNGRRGGSSRY